MISIKSNIKDDFKLNDEELKKLLDLIHERNQGFYTLAEDEDYAKKIEGKFEHIVVLGIGGSALGTACLQKSLKNFSNSPKLHILDNIDPNLITEIENKIDYSKTLFIVATKSGTTPETLFSYFYFRKKCDEKKLSIHEHFVFITDPEKGFLREISNEEKITTFDTPQNVEGRFSILTPVSLLPAKLIGIDITKILAGAKTMRNRFLSENNDENLPYQLAKIQYELYKKGKIINVLMPYSQKLIGLADWYRQLLAESIGKNEKTGITPVNALGVTDQHSQLQLYNEGPNDKLIIFIEVKNLGPEIQIPNIYPEKEEAKFLEKGLTFNKLMEIEKKSTEQSLTKNSRPNLTILLNEVTEESMGELVMLLMGSVAFLGELFGINAYDQPGVEASKKLTKEAILKL